MELHFKLKQFLVFMLLCFLCYLILWILLDLLMFEKVTGRENHNIVKSHQLPPVDANDTEHVKQHEETLQPRVIVQQRDAISQNTRLHLINTNFTEVFKNVQIGKQPSVNGQEKHVISKSKQLPPKDPNLNENVKQLEVGIQPNITFSNRHDYSFIINNSNKCNSIENKKMFNTDQVFSVVFLIRSSVNNFERRLAIRRTWGMATNFDAVYLESVFLLGTMNNPSLQNRLVEENGFFHDILQADFLDSYYNCTVKLMMALQWVVKFCPSGSFYVFVDDDYYVSMHNLVRFLRNPFSYPDENAVVNQKIIGNVLKEQRHTDLDNNNEHLFYAGYLTDHYPFRSTNSKWYISNEEYPYDMYPPFINGGAHVMSTRAVHKFYYATFFVKRFRFDDVYIGIIAHSLEVKPMHCKYFLLGYNTELFEKAVVSHGFSDPTFLEETWKKLHIF